MCYQILHSETTFGNRKKGNLSTFRSNFKRDLELFNIPLKTWQLIANDKKKWSKKVNFGVKLCYRQWLLDHRSIRTYNTEDITERGKKLKKLALTTLDDVLISLGYFLKSDNRKDDLQRRYQNVFNDDLQADLASIFECTIY